LTTGIDKVVDRGDLRGNVLAGRNDLELLDLGGDFRRSGIGLRRLDHLDTPGVGDEAVSQRDAIGTLFRRKLEELGVLGPRHEALRIGGRAGDDLGAGSQGGASENGRQ